MSCGFSSGSVYFILLMAPDRIKNVFFISEIKRYIKYLASVKRGPFPLEIGKMCQQLIPAMQTNQIINAQYSVRQVKNIGPTLKWSTTRHITKEQQSLTRHLYLEIVDTSAGKVTH